VAVLIQIPLRGAGAVCGAGRSTIAGRGWGVVAGRRPAQPVSATTATRIDARPRPIEQQA
jgi:hypothetical protein